MKQFIAKQKEFISKVSELLKEEKFEEVVKSFEENSEELATLEKSLEEEETKAEELEKKALDEEEEKEAARIKKYAEIFANAEDLKTLLSSLKEAQDTIAVMKSANEELEKRIEKMEESSDDSAQPDEEIKKAEKISKMGEGFDAFLN